MVDQAPTPTRADVFASGPSIRAAAPPPFGGSVRICANRRPTVNFPSYDWLVFGDRIALTWLRDDTFAKPQTGILTLDDFAVSAEDALPGVNVLRRSDLVVPVDPAVTANISIWLAAHLGCTEIHLWGYDHEGAFYADGTPCPDFRAGPRWPLERPIFEATIAGVLEQHPGTIIIRHGIDGVEQVATLEPSDATNPH